jgi:LPS export ABC transporter protein LptC
MTASLTRLGVAAVALITLLGCGRSRTPANPQPPPPPKSATAHEIAKTTIKFADPQGRWTLQLEADRAEAVALRGPYNMSPARARYDEEGRPSVTISAKRAHVDEDARRVTFEGDVRIDSATWRLQADRAEYDLNTGKVAATGHTKWTLAEAPSPAAQHLSPHKDDRR